MNACVQLCDTIVCDKCEFDAAPQAMTEWRRLFIILLLRNSDNVIVPTLLSAAIKLKALVLPDFKREAFMTCDKNNVGQGCFLLSLT